MAKKDTTRCWVCSRTPDDVRESAGRPQASESEVDRKARRIRDSRSTFSRESGEWWSKVPDQLKEMDFEFVVGNVSQFSGALLVQEAANAKSGIAERVVAAASSARKGGEVELGDVKIGANDEVKRKAMLRTMEEFERRTGRALTNGDGSKDHPHGFEKLDFLQGMNYLKDLGNLYYSIQEEVIEIEREEEMSMRPAFGVGITRVPSIPWELHICTICQTVITATPFA